LGGEGLRPWWHTAMPHRDIREGRFDPRVFAVDLAQVIEGQIAAKDKIVYEYKDADTFFRRTFLTQGLRSTVRGVLRSLAGRDDGIAITQMATVFGGGKTHTLLALYHMVERGSDVIHLEPVRQLLAEAGLDASSPLLAGGMRGGAARIAAVDCAHIGPSQPRRAPEGLTLHTLWGEIAYRLAGVRGYEFVRQSDEDRVVPGSQALAQLFQATGPALILIGETLSYITKASGIPVGQGYLSDQAQEFLLELTRAVNAADDVALVLTMTSSEQEQIGDAAIRAAKEIDTAILILRRTRQVEVSAEREELYEILKRRLFDTDPALIEAQARGVARAYWDYCRAHPNDFPQEAQTPEYRELMVRAYPFHPALIEVLRDRWGSISGFQRTRGVLRLLALVIGDLYQRQHAAPLVQPAHVSLDHDEIRAELLEYVDNRGGYESVIFSDIGGTDESKAPHLDRVTGGDYARYCIATGLTTSIFMYSHSGATQRVAAAERPQLWLSTLQPGIVPALAADALDKLERRLWYLDAREGTYRIDSQPNLNQMLVTRIDAMRQEPEVVREQVRQAVEEVVGRRPFPTDPLIWPAEPGHVLADPDSQRHRRTVSYATLDPAVPDQYYPYFVLTDSQEPCAKRSSYFRSPAGDLVHVQDLRPQDRVRVQPGRFDYEYLDTTTRRYDVVRPAGDRGRYHAAIGGPGPRPYRRADRRRLGRLWWMLSGRTEHLVDEAIPAHWRGLTTTQVYALRSLLASRWEAWDVGHDARAQAAWPRFVEDTLINVFGPANWQAFAPDDRGAMCWAGQGGALFDVIELYGRLAKESSRLSEEEED